VVEAVIGSGMSRDKAEKRLLTGLSRVNSNFDVEIVAAANYKKGDLLPS